jgi:hypothetical protein
MNKEQIIDNLVAEFKHHVELGTASWARAGQAVAKAFELDPEILPKFVLMTKMAPSTIKLFLRIGNGTLLPQLLPAPKRVRALPLADQKRVVAGTLPCAVLRADGETDVRRVDIMSATPDVLDVMIGPSGLRTETEQLVFLRAKARRIAAESSAAAEIPRAVWEVCPLGIRVTRAGIISPAVLMRMVKEAGIKVRRERRARRA